MKKIFFLISIICLSLNSSKAQVTSSWQNYFSDASVKIEYQEIAYQEPNTDINKQLLVFKLTNLTDKKISINWRQKLQYGSICYNCSGNSKEMNFSISVDANSSIEGDPASHKTDGLVIIKQFNSPEIVKSKTIPLTNYELKNIEVLIPN